MSSMCLIKSACRKGKKKKNQVNEYVSSREAGNCNQPLLVWGTQKYIIKWDTVTAMLRQLWRQRIHNDSAHSSAVGRQSNNEFFNGLSQITLLSRKNNPHFRGPEHSCFCPPPPPRIGNITLRMLMVERNGHKNPQDWLYQALVSCWSLMFWQLHRVSSGRMTHSHLYQLNTQVTKPQVNNWLTVLDTAVKANKTRSKQSIASRSQHLYFTCLQLTRVFSNQFFAQL